MTSIAIMQPYLLPYIGYFQTMSAVNKYVIYDDVQFIKGGWINRNNILIGGEKSRFTMALKDASANKLINQIDIRDDFGKLRKTFAMNYARAPYARETLLLLDSIFEHSDRNLARFVGHSLKMIGNHLGLTCEIMFSSSLSKGSALKAQDRVIEICTSLGATTYINSIGGQDLYNRDDFDQHGVELKFLRTEFAEYRQFKNSFVPGLSIVDILMFNSPKTVTGMLSNYELV